MNDLLLLPSGEKKVAAKVLYRLGWGSIKIERMLGISDNTVLRAIDQPTPDELKGFEEEFQESIKDMKREGVAKVHKRLLELIPKEKRIDQVVKAGEFLEGKQSSNNVAVQINNVVGSKKNEYAI